MSSCNKKRFIESINIKQDCKSSNMVFRAFLIMSLVYAIIYKNQKRLSTKEYKIIYVFLKKDGCQSLSLTFYIVSLDML